MSVRPGSIEPLLPSRVSGFNYLDRIYIISVSSGYEFFIKDLFVLIENIFYKNIYNCSYKIRWQKMFYLFNIIYEECNEK